MLEAPSLVARSKCSTQAELRAQQAADAPYTQHALPLTAVHGTKPPLRFVAIVAPALTFQQQGHFNRVGTPIAYVLIRRSRTYPSLDDISLLTLFLK
ncbi:hypothetical protein [Thauera humireducens]|jgi:hypothetical protein|uniref:hypothetical protein n=1 Tax=Thauera humireducens TaxID=1134435 RepID=UPI0024A84C20|nr:hypothetical protein [Thauera humireducens]